MKENKETKTCSKCNTVKPITDYYTYKKTGNPWAYCRSCHYSLYTKAGKEKWDKKNPERKRELQRQGMYNWIEKNPIRWREIQAKAYQRQKLKKNKEHI